MIVHLNPFWLAATASSSGDAELLLLLLCVMR